MDFRRVAPRRPVTFDRLEDRRLLTLTMTGANVVAAQQQPFNGLVAVVFDTKVLKDTPASFNSVTIDWGDGQTSSGQVVGPVALGVFQVIGGHTYAQAGSFRTLVSVATVSGGNASATARVTVEPAPFPVNVNSISGPPGKGFPADATVATFLSPNSSASAASDFSAIIDWGDGQTSTGTIGGSTGAYTVDTPEGHTYGSAGVYTIAVTITSTDNLQSTGTGEANIAIPSNYVATGRLIVVPVGQVFNGVVATFTAPDTPMNFTASIDWGDGDTTPATITPVNGGFAIEGSYTYPTPGTYTVTVTVADEVGHTFTVTDTADVTTAGLPGNGPVFTGILDPNATINGRHAAGGITTTHRPTFRGTAAPYATVQLYARHFDIDAVLPLGETVADSNGNWTLATGPLAAGAYTFTATVTPPGGYPSDMMTLTNQKGGQIIYIDLTPRLVHQLSHSRTATPHHHHHHHHHHRHHHHPPTT